MTSNLGNEAVSKYAIGFDNNSENYNDKNPEYELMKEKVMQSLKDNFKPEFLNRIDETIIFHTLTKNDISLIVDIQVDKLIKKLIEKNINLTVTKKVKEYLAQKGFDKMYGARPLKRLIQNEILNQLAMELISNKKEKKMDITVDVKNDKIIIK